MIYKIKSYFYERATIIKNEREITLLTYLLLVLGIAWKMEGKNSVDFGINIQLLKKNYLKLELT